VRHFVDELQEYSLPLMLPEVEVNSVLGAVRLILRTLMDTQPVLPPAAKGAIDGILSKSPGKLLDQLTQVEECANHLRSEIAHGPMSNEWELRRIVLALLDYAANPGFKLRCYWEEESAIKTAASSGTGSSAEVGKNDAQRKDPGERQKRCQEP
jgi:hypothetical protein